MFLRTTLSNSINIPASGGHPPLYFAAMYYWMRLPLGLEWMVQGRTFSVLSSLLATIVVDRLWARYLPGWWRVTFMALWTLSPFLLLYSRMSRSYSMQLLVGTAAAGYLLLFLTGKRDCPTKPLTFWLAVGVYVHAIPGFALLTTANLVLLWRRKIRAVIVIDCIVSLLYLPWLMRLLAFLPTWGARGGDQYALTGRLLIEILVKIAYWAFSFTMGEAVPDAVLLMGVLVGFGVAVLIVYGIRRRPELLWVAAPAALVGFLGVTRWVSYPFVPARMIFLFPVFLMTIVSGASAHRRLGPSVAAGMVALSLSGIWSYFQLIGFRNKEYPMPMAAIASQIRRESSGGYRVLVDSSNADPFALKYQLGPVLETSAPGTAAEVDKLLADPHIRMIWFLRNTHDVSTAQLNRQFEQKLSGIMHETVFPIELLTPLEIRVATSAGLKDPPRYFQELLKFERVSQ